MFDALNGVWYLVEGDGVSATISFASTIPLVYATTVKNIGRVIKLSDGTFATIKLSRQATETLIATLKNSNLSENSLKLLFKDLENTNFAKALAENPKLIDAWETVIGNPMIRKDIKALESVSKIIDNKNLASVITKTDLSNIVNKLAQKGVKCRTCTGGNSAFKYLDEILDDIEFGAVKYGDEYTSVLTGFKQGGNFAEGTMFVASSLKKYPNDFPVGTVFELTEVTVGGVRRVDVRVSNTFFEFKSVALTNGMPPNGFANQFIKDLQLANVTDLSQIKWWFDASKTSSLSKVDFLNALQQSNIDPLIINKFVPGIPDIIQARQLFFTELSNNFNALFLLK